MKVKLCDDRLRYTQQLLGGINSGLEWRANVNIICSVVYLLHVMFFEDVLCEELLFVETTHRKALLMEVAVVMRGLLFVYAPQTPLSRAHACVSPSFESITLTFTL